MSDESKLAIRAEKISGIILNLCELFHVSLEKATDIYYNSVTADMVEEGVADLQCRSDKYLASIVWEEYQEGVDSI